MTSITIREKLLKLIASGVDPKVVAERAGCHVSTIYRIRDGIITDPSYSIGAAIDGLVNSLSSSDAA